MREPLWILENDARVALRERLAKDRSCGTKICAEAARDAMLCVNELKSLAVSRTEAPIRALQELAEAMGMFDRIERTGEREATFSSLCTFLMHVEEKRTALDATLLSCCDVWERAYACNECLLRAHGTVKTVREELGATVDADVCDVERAVSMYEQVMHEFDAFRAQVFSLSTERVPRICQAMREHADFPGRGEACDLHAIGMLCRMLQSDILRIEPPHLE